MHVVIAMGSNLGERQATLDNAVSKMSSFCTSMKVSSYIETDPVGGPEQPIYLNAVVVCETELTPHDLLKALQAIEDEAGRTREVRWGARTLDLDLITYGQLMSDDPDLLLPHPRAHERRFVLAPWNEVDSNAHLPGIGKVSDLLNSL